MQTITTPTNISTENYAAGGRKSSSALGADFAAMLNGVGDLQSGMQGINGIFSAMKDLQNSKQAVSKTNTSQTHVNSNKVSVSAQDKKSIFAKDLSANKVSDKKTIEKNSSSQDDDREVSEGKEQNSTDETVTAWMTSLFGNDEQGIDKSKSAQLKSEQSSDLKNTANALSKQTNSGVNGNKNFIQEQETLADLNKNKVVLDKEQSSVAMLMAQGNLKNVTVVQSSAEQNSQMLATNADDLSFINDSLQAAAKLVTQNNTDSSNGQGNFSGNDQDAQQQSVNAALATLRQTLIKDQTKLSVPDDEINANQVNAAAPKTVSSGEKISANVSAAGFSEDLSGAAQSLSDARRVQKENSQTSLRQDMLTLSNDAKKNAEEISKAVMSMAAKNMKRFTFELNPHGLGRMEISVDADESSQPVAVSVAAEEQTTRRMLQDSLSSLKQILADQGVDADAFMGEFTGSSGSEDGSFAGSGNFSGNGSQEQSDTLFAGNVAKDPDVNKTEENLPNDDDGLNLFA